MRRAFRHAAAASRAAAQLGKIRRTNERGGNQQAQNGWLSSLPLLLVPTVSLANSSTQDDGSTATAACSDSCPDGTCSTIGEDEDAKQQQQQQQRTMGSPLVSNDSTAKFKIYTNMARELVAQGRMEEAERYLSNALVQAEQGYGSASDPHVASACNNLAELHKVRGRPELAGPLYDKALSILHDAYGPDDARLAAALHNAAGFHLTQGRWEEAARLYSQALAAFRAALGPRHRAAVATLCQLADLRWARGERAEALALAEEALDVLDEQQQPGGAASTRAGIMLMSRLAGMLFETEGRGEDAVALMRRILHQAEQQSDGPEQQQHAAVLQSLDRLAAALQRQGRPGEAAHLLSRCLNMREERLGPAHPSVGVTLRRLAYAELDLSQLPHPPPTTQQQQQQQQQPSSFGAPTAGPKEAAAEACGGEGGGGPGQKEAGHHHHHAARALRCAQRSVGIAQDAWHDAREAAEQGGGGGGGGWWPFPRLSQGPVRQTRVPPVVAAAELSTALQALSDVLLAGGSTPVAGADEGALEHLLGALRVLQHPLVLHKLLQTSAAVAEGTQGATAAQQSDSGSSPEACDAGSSSSNNSTSTPRGAGEPATNARSSEEGAVDGGKGGSIDGQGSEAAAPRRRPLAVVARSDAAAAALWRDSAREAVAKAAKRLQQQEQDVQKGEGQRAEAAAARGDESWQALREEARKLEELLAGAK